MWWWRTRTRARLLRPAVRGEWQRIFRTHPMLHNARHYADRPQLGHAQMAFETFAGFYNDRVEGGFMTVDQARSIYGETQ